LVDIVKRVCSFAPAKRKRSYGDLDFLEDVFVLLIWRGEKKD
jgi:hypothetical protein